MGRKNQRHDGKPLVGMNLRMQESGDKKGVTRLIITCTYPEDIRFAHDALAAMLAGEWSTSAHDDEIAFTSNTGDVYPLATNPCKTLNKGSAYKRPLTHMEKDERIAALLAANERLAKEAKAKDAETEARFAALEARFAPPKAKTKRTTRRK